MENPDAETRFFTTTKDKYNTMAYFVFHNFGKVRGFYDWWATLDVREQENAKNSLVSIIRSVIGAENK